MGPQGRWLRFNQRLCDLLGYSPAELAARTYLDVTHPDDREASSAHFQRLLAGEMDAYELEKRYVRQDGALVWAHLTVSLVRTPEGAPANTIQMVQDITERKRLEQDHARLLGQERAARLEAEATRVEAEATNAQLQAMQALTDTALSHLALDDLLRELLGRVTAVLGVDNVAILLLDENDQTLTVRAARGPEEEAIGRTRIPVGQGFSGRIAASKEPLIVDDLATFEAGRPLLGPKLRAVVGVPLLMEEQMAGQPAVDRLVGVLHVGSVAPRRFTAADVELLQRAADRVALAIGRALLYAAEQNARQQAEAALARALVSETEATGRAQRLQTILETMADGVAVYDAQGRPVQMNRAYRELYALERAPAGFESLSALDRARLLHLRDAVTGAPLPLERVPIARALRGELVTGPEADLLLRTFDGRELEVNASAVPMREPDGRIVGTMSVLRDRSKSAQRRIERATGEDGLQGGEERLALLAQGRQIPAEPRERLRAGIAAEAA